MDLTSAEELQRFADDVRTKEAPFNDAASEAFKSLFAGEYRRLRAAQLESGDSLVTLHVAVRCNFEAGSVEVITTPSPVQPRPRQRAVKISTPS